MEFRILKPDVCPWSNESKDFVIMRENPQQFYIYFLSTLIYGWGERIDKTYIPYNIWGFILKSGFCRLGRYIWKQIENTINFCSHFLPQ